MIRIIFKLTARLMWRDMIISDIKKIERRMPSFFRQALPKCLSIIFVTPRHSRMLNMRYRKKNKPTSVLSFVYSRGEAEIFIAPSVVQREAKTFEQPFDEMLAKMIIHGMIHCSGLDHERSRSEDKKFTTLEKQLFKKL